jgi:radical SAM superfamily enzyme YgiQ (UPF0313 family)
MSSLGFQRIYRAIMETPGWRASARSSDDAPSKDPTPERPVTYESERPLEDFPVVALSAWPTSSSSPGSSSSSRPPASRRGASTRDERHPFILAGGPLTFSNPLPLAGLADAVIVGEAEQITVDVCAELDAARAARAAARRLSRSPHVFVPSHHGAMLPPVAKVDDALLPPGPPSARRTPSSRHVPHRDRARLLALVHLLRHAPLDQRRHAHRPGRRILELIPPTPSAWGSSARP